MAWTYRELAGMLVAGSLFVMAPFLLPHESWDEPISVAFIGNSMFYYNDVPRLMEAISDGKITQDSCLHGDGTFTSLLYTGNGMLKKWNTSNAIIPNRHYNSTIYDFGACTVRQLLFGEDEGLENETMMENVGYVSDGQNPCFVLPDYNSYLLNKHARKKRKPKWDYILLNDNTRSAPRFTSRMESLDALDEVYVDWIRSTGAIPVFLHPHAYWSPYRDMGGLENVSIFTSFAYSGYVQYADLLAKELPAHQAPRIAPVGIAFLTIWEEDRAMWRKLIHSDHVHGTPLGTFLEACVLYHTLYGRMPAKEHAFPVQGMKYLWRRARMMQPLNHPPNPWPTPLQAQYVYHVAERVVKYGHRPKCFVEFTHGEAAYYDEELGYYL